MLTFAYDTIAHNDDGTRVELHPNCQVWSASGRPELRRFESGTLGPIYVLERHRLRCERTDLLLRAGRPFVYPLELWYTMTGSFAENPELAPGIPAAVLERVRAGRAAILVWIGHEHIPPALEFDGGPSALDVVLKFIRDHALPPQQVWFASGDMLGEDRFTGWLRQRGLSEAGTFQFRTLTMSLSTVGMQYRANARGEDLVQRRDGDVLTLAVLPLSSATFAERYLQPTEIADERRLGKLRPKRFLSMNGTPRLHRQMLVSYLHGKGLLDDSLVSFGFGPVPLDLNNTCESPILPEFMRASWRALHSRLPLVVDGIPPDALNMDLHKVASGWPYRATYFNIAAETGVSPHVGPLITEKVMKPMVNFQPVIAISTTETLRYLRSAGFKTFAGVIDETYDGIRDPAQRIARIFEQIDRLGQISQAEARDRYFACLPELEHNHAHVIDGRFALDELFDALEAQLG